MLASYWLAENCLASHWPEEHNLRTLLHDRHCILVLLLVGPQGGKCSPLIGWRRNILFLIVWGTQGTQSHLSLSCWNTGHMSAHFSLAGVLIKLINAGISLVDELIVDVYRYQLV